LCRALAKLAAPSDCPRRILEVGPGTGVVTDAILAIMGPDDTLDLVELNDRFVEALRGRLATDNAWQRSAPRVAIHHMAVEQLDATRPYNVIVSGLPLNNFDVAVVRGILDQFARLTATGGTVSFFEYVAVRKLKGLVCRRAERERLAGVGAAVGEACRRWEFDRDLVLANVPPAWVHHLRVGG
jgi:phospholipid N-methyltransferase